MDKQHKDDLRKNELAEAVLHTGDWWQTHGKRYWDKYGTLVLLVILVIVAGFTGVRYLRGVEQRRLDTAFTQLNEAGSPNAKLAVAEDYEGKIPGFGSMARIAAADLLVREALLGESALGATPLTEDQKKDNLQRAAKLYTEAVTRHETPLLIIYARRGLASVSESLGDFKTAREQYELVQKEAAEAYPGITDVAKKRMDDLDRLAKPVVFAPPKPKPAPSTSGIPGHEGLNIPGLDLPLGPPVPASIPSTSPAPAVPGLEIPPPAPAPTTPPAPAPAPEPTQPK